MVTFIKPITVGTIDQLLTVGFNSGKWTLKEINTSNAVVIIDEIHAYDGWTLGLIISTIKHFSPIGTRFMLMSATLPSFLQKLFEKELGINSDEYNSLIDKFYNEDTVNAFIKNKACE